MMKSTRASMVEIPVPDGHHLVLRTGPPGGKLDRSLQLTADGFNPGNYRISLAGEIYGLDPFDGEPFLIERDVLDPILGSLRAGLSRYPPSTVMVEETRHVADGGPGFNVTIGPSVRSVTERSSTAEYGPGLGYGVPRSTEEIEALIYHIKINKGAPVW